MWVGSTNPSKVEAARRVFESWLPGCRVFGKKVPSGVPEQPIGGRETRSGALNRSQNVREGRAVWSIGMEGGVEFLDGQAYLINWCAVISPEGQLSLAQGVSLPLPDEVGRAVASGGELGPVMERWTGLSRLESSGGAIGYLTLGRVTRSQLWQQALWCALSPFLLRMNRERASKDIPKGP